MPLHPLAQAIASGATPTALPIDRGPTRVQPEWLTTVAHHAFITGLNRIFVVAAFVLFAGAILAFVLVRQRDFVASGPQVAAEAG